MSEPEAARPKRLYIASSTKMGPAMHQHHTWCATESSFFIGRLAVRAAFEEWRHEVLAHPTEIVWVMRVERAKACASFAVASGRRLASATVDEVRGATIGV